MTFRFKCSSCDKLHEGMPAFGFKAPDLYFDVPESERETRCILGKDGCVIDNRWFFVRGCLDIHVHHETEPFSWGVWVSLSAAHFEEWRKVYKQARRSHVGPFFGWLSIRLRPYPDTENLKTMVHLRDGVRPYIELEPTDHPLAVEQRHGISVERVAEIYGQMMPH